MVSRGRSWRGGHRATCEAALRVLDAGGNAFDAIVAAGFASATSEPLMTGLGGGGFCLTRTAAGEETLFDFFVDTPGRGLDPMPEPHFFPVAVRYPGVDQVFNTGLGSAAVPGTVDGYLAIHERLGRLPLAEVVAPAIELAREGVVLDEFHGSVSDLLWPILALTEDGRRLFGVDGDRSRRGTGSPTPTPVASSLSCRPIPATASGRRVGATRSVRDMAAGEGLITAEDLAAYAVVEREPLAVRYRDRTVLTNPPPAFGGELIGRGLGFLAEGLPTPGAWGDPVAPDGARSGSAGPRGLAGPLGRACGSAGARPTPAWPTPRATWPRCRPPTARPRATWSRGRA